MAEHKGVPLGPLVDVVTTSYQWNGYNMFLVEHYSCGHCAPRKQGFLGPRKSKRRHCEQCIKR